RLDGGLDGEVFQGAGGLAVGLERVDVLDDAGVLHGDGGVAEGDLLLALGRHREYAHAEHVAAHVFEQAGVLGAADDVGVALPGPGGLKQLALDLLVADPHGELIDTGALGHGEDVGGFELAVGVVAESLFDAGDGDLVIDGDGHAVVDHGQGGQV